MWSNISIRIRKSYKQIINSIAFYPAVIAALFLLLSYLLIAFDFSDTGKQLKSNLSWLSLKDASTARSIISSIVSGIISLAVFSFSMVMIILNQTASQMSNRILDKLIGNRFQQIVLGIYIGTIVFALFLLSTIRDIHSGIYIPALSTYALIALTIFDIFLFIYFLHFITQSVKYNVIIRKIYDETKLQMEKLCTENNETNNTEPDLTSYLIDAGTSGIFESFNKTALLAICEENDCSIHIFKTPGTFVLDDTHMITIDKELPDDELQRIRNTLEIGDSEPIEENFFNGYRQLTEVALKALSPGINDPRTAIQSLHALAKLFNYRLSHYPCNSISDKEKKVRIITRQLTFEELFTKSILPIWDYGKDDRMIQLEMLAILTSLSRKASLPAVEKLIDVVQKAVVDKQEA